MERISYDHAPILQYITFTPEQLEEFTIRISKEIEVAVIKKLDSYQAGKQDVKLSREEAALYIKVSPSTLGNWNKSGYLVPERAGRRCLYPKQLLDKFVKSHFARKSNS